MDYKSQLDVQFGFFLTIEDIRTRYPEYVTDQITDSDYTMFNNYEAESIEMVKNFSDNRYNISFELTKEGSDRSYGLVDYILSIFSYKLELRKGTVEQKTDDSYEDTVSYLKMIMKKQMNTTWLPRDLEADDKTTSTKFHYEQRINYMY